VEPIHERGAGMGVHRMEHVVTVLVEQEDGTLLNHSDSRRWAINKYRVLLTRARLGSVIWVPEGSADDPTRDSRVRDEIADVLLAAGTHRFS
jgi:hypothetical protein